jgi:hypothetical protein
LGHLNVRDVMRLSRAGRIDGLSQVSEREVKSFECTACMLGKGKRLPSPQSSIRATEPLNTVHIDIWGPASTPSHGGLPLLPDLL